MKNQNAISLVSIIFNPLSIKCIFHQIKLLALRFLLITMLIISFNSSANEQKGAVEGQVVDNESGLPLVGAHIHFHGRSIGTYTNSQGKFKIENLVPGEYVIDITYLGYGSKQYKIQVTADHILSLNADLQPEVLELSKITINEFKYQKLNAINAIDIAFKPVNSAQEFLNIVPGLFIAQHSGGGKAEQIFFRGFDIDHGTDLNIQVDGMPVNMVSHTHGQGYSDLHFIIPELVDKITYQKGPYAAGKGNFATTGAVEFNTYNRLESNQIKLTTGLNNTWRGYAQIKILDKISDNAVQHAYVAMEHYFTDGYFDSPQNLNRTNIFGKYHGYIRDKTLLSATISTFFCDWRATGQIPERAVNQGTISRYGTIDQDEGGKTSRSSVNLNISHALNNGGVLSHQWTWHQYEFDLVSNFTFFLNDPVNGDEIRQKERRQIWGFKGGYSNNTTLFNLNLDFTTGWGTRYDNIDGNELSNTKNGDELIRNIRLGDINEINSYLFGEIKMNFNAKTSLTAGLRADHFVFEYHDKTTSPSIQYNKNALIINPKFSFDYYLNSHWQLFARAGTGIHSNDARTLLLENNPEILPKARGLDFGVVVNPAKSLIINSAFWILKSAQELVYVGDEGIVEMTGKTLRKGVDLSLRYHFNKWLNMDMDINLADARALSVQDNQRYIPLAPRFSSTGGLNFTKDAGIQGSLRYRYLADRPANEDYSLKAEGYFLLDAQIQWKQPKYVVDLSINNLFNTKWKETQFATTSRLENEIDPVDEIHFVSGTPFFVKLGLSLLF